MRAKPTRLYLLYTSESAFQVSGTSLAKALKASGIDERKTPIVAAIEAHCVASSALEVDAPTIAAVVIRNPCYRGGDEG